MKLLKSILIFVFCLFLNQLVTAQTVYKVGKKDTLFQGISFKNRYSVTLKSTVYPVQLNQIHDWILHIETTDAKNIEDAKIHIEGGMPDHGHGFPTTPSVSRHLGNGNYRVEGMKFSMYGVWAMEFSIASTSGFDKIRYLLKIVP